MRWLSPVLGLAALALAVGLGYLWGGRTKRSPSVQETIASEDAVHERRGAPTRPPRAAQRPAALPTLPAPPGPTEEEPEDITGEEERRRKIEQMRASGPDRRDLLGTIRASFGDWKRALHEPRIDVNLGEWQCFRAGCYVSLVHASSALVSESTRRLTETKSFLRWNSSKMRSAEIVRPDGRVEITWLLFAPPEGEPIMQASLGGD